MKDSVKSANQAIRVVAAKPCQDRTNYQRGRNDDPRAATPTTLNLVWVGFGHGVRKEAVQLSMRMPGHVSVPKTIPCVQVQQCILGKEKRPVHVYHSCTDGSLFLYASGSVLASGDVLLNRRDCTAGF